MAKKIKKVKLGETTYDLCDADAVHSVEQDGVSGATVNRFGTCATEADTAAKTADITTGTFNLIIGAKVTIKFTNKNTANSPTLNVNGQGAKTIFYKGSQITTGANKGLLYGTVDFVYDGIQWQLIGPDVSHKPIVSETASSTLTGATGTKNTKIATGITTADLYIPVATASTPGTTVVYPEASCTAFSSDTGALTPAAAQKAAKQFAITRPPKKGTSEGDTSVTINAIPRWEDATGDLKNSTILIEDVTNTRDTTKKANVLSIPAGGDKKMVYGYCTDQVDGTSFIGGLFPADATEFSYADGLAIGGTSGNLLWKSKRVLDAGDTGVTVSKVGHSHGVSTSNAAPQGHTHTVTVSGTSSAYNGTAVTALTGVKVTTQPTVSLIANDATATGRITYVQSISSGSGSLIAYDALTGGTAKTINGNRIQFITSLSKDGYTPAGSVSLTNGTAPSMNFNTGKNTDTPYISALTNGSYTPAGSVTLTNGTPPSMGSATTKYLHFSAGTTPPSSASFSGSAVTSGDASAITTSSTGGNTSTTSNTSSAGGGTASQDTGAATPSFTGSAVTSGGASSSTTSSAGANTSTTSNTGNAGSATTASVSNGILIIYDVTNHAHTYYAPVAHTHTMSHTHSVTAEGTVGSHTHTYTKPAAHTHTYYGPVAHTHTLSHTHSVTAAGTVTLAAGTAPSLTANTTADGGITYVEAQGSFSAGTTPKSGASFAGTATTALVTSGTTNYMKFSAGTTPKSGASFAGTNSTAVVTGGTTYYLAHGHTGAGATTKYLSASASGTAVGDNGTASVAPSGHTHSYGSSTALTTTGNSGNAVAAVTEVEASTD